ncbi:MAG: hypothetical protein OIF34_01925 [Porticoccaceae bacterium]|nr:hypothetical protein [Porticoccaceae bacterium]
MKFATSLLSVCVLALGLLPSQFVSASGSGGYSGGSAFPSGSQRQRPVDAVYEHGKSLVSGRNKTYGKMKICINNSESGESQKIKRKYLKPYKQGKALDFANNLHNCKLPEQKVVDIYARNDLAALIHYYNKRYKLKLQY